MAVDMPIRLLQALVALADTGTFTAAASEMHLSQPALSQSIRRLESLVGVRLVDRHPSGGTLTPAGESLADDGRLLLARIDGAFARALRAGDGSGPPDLVVGFGTTTPRHVTKRMLDIGETMLDLRVRLEHVPWGQEAARLMAGAVDLVVMTTGGEVGHDREVTVIGSYPRLAVFPADHPLARRDSISIGELDLEPIIDAGSDREYWLALPRPSGVMPPIMGPPARTVEEMLAFVSAGRGMAITSASVAESVSTESIRFVEIDDLPPVTLGLARLRDDERPRLQRFLTAVVSSFG